ncbi:MAG: cation:proton antiporter [Candidatus Cloacimonetes bacterium HGW-Cloacimonetes-1]|jgi:multicomponent Na+:H+ antiporter subunit C|nr:MAG: cation:proton antiporter [Candidatus Cloacimonetes bacterium HGW-Cloacimonetes-1]
MMVMICGIILILIGIWAMLSRKNIIRIIIGFSIVDTGTHLVIVAIGYVKGATAPILDASIQMGNVADSGMRVLSKVVDPVPSALVLTAIVIGLAVTALLLAFAVRLYRTGHSLNINDYEEQKW